jgi:hypothetical protein
MRLYSAKEARCIANDALTNEFTILQRVWGDIDKEAKKGRYMVNVVVPKAFVEIVVWNLKRAGFKAEPYFEEAENCHVAISWDEQ